MLIIGWSSFCIAVLVLKSVTSLSHNRYLHYYDGSRGRMDKNYYTDHEFFQRNSRPKRTPHSPNLWAKSSESQGVSCPTRLRESSLDMLGDSDRMKEVVHIPCPKRKSSGAKVVASLKGKSMQCDGRSHKGNRGARELFKKNARSNDLNHAVMQNAQWLILSSQDRIQKPNQGQKINSSMNPDRTGQNRNVNQPLPNDYQGMSNEERPAIWRHPKGAKEEPRKTQNSKLNRYLPGAASQSKPNFQAPQTPRLKDAVLVDKVAQQFSAVPYQGYYNLEPPRNLQIQVPHPQAVPNQGPYPKKDKPFQNSYEANRLPMNGYNITYDGPHHGPQNQPNNSNPPNPSGHLAYPNPNPNPQGQMPSFFQSHATPPNYYNTYTILYNTTPPDVPKTFQNTNETRNGPWAPGAMEVDIPPGYPHQPKIPKITTKSFDPVNIKDLPKSDQKLPGSNNLPNLPKHDIQGAQYQYQRIPNEKPQQDSWIYRDGPYSNKQLLQNPNMPRQGPQVGSHDKPGMTPSLEKSTQAYKGVFAKSKKEESKAKLIKPAKIPASNIHSRVPVDAQRGPASRYGGNMMSNAKPDESAASLPQPELRPRQQNSQANNEAAQFRTESKMQNSKYVIPFRKMSQDRSESLNERGYQGHRNFSGDMSHILNPPVTMDTNLYTNRAHKIASKFVSSDDVTYVPFRGVPPARNDEAFYDKNLNFLGKIDRPPLVNIKRHKWSKLNRRFKTDRTYNRLHADYPMGFYSEPADFHSDMSVEDFGSQRHHKKVDRQSRKCHNNRKPNWQRSNTHTRTIA